MNDAVLYYAKNGECTRKINYLVVHCSATKENSNFDVDALRHLHVDINHWQDIGYHFYITKDGVIHKCRPMKTVGAHVSGYNTFSIGVCYEGGLNREGTTKDTRTALQKQSLIDLLKVLIKRWPSAIIKGHRDFPKVKKACPCFDAQKEYGEI